MNEVPEKINALSSASLQMGSRAQSKKPEKHASLCDQIFSLNDVKERSLNLLERIRGVEKDEKSLCTPRERVSLAELLAGHGSKEIQVFREEVLQILSEIESSIF